MIAVRPPVLGLFYFSTPSEADELSVCCHDNCVAQRQAFLKRPHLKAPKTLLRQSFYAVCEYYSRDRRHSADMIDLEGWLSVKNPGCNG